MEVWILSDMKFCQIDEHTKSILLSIDNNLKINNLIKLYELNLISPQKLIELIEKNHSLNDYGLKDLKEELIQAEGE